MDYRDFQEELKNIILPLVKEEGFVLVELKFIRTGRNFLLRLLVDRPQGGISLSDCAQLNENIGRLLDEKDAIQNQYNLEVSSPGLDRNLVTEEDFSRCLDRNVRINLKEPVSGRMDWEGRIKKVEAGLLYLETDKGIIEIGLSNIAMAKQVIA